VTAKHVLRDYDGTFLPKLKVRLNLKQPATGDVGYGFIDNVPVADAKGNLVWFHDERDPSNEAVVLPLLPDDKTYDWKDIDLPMLMTETQMKSDAVAEGDSLYFIGLMAQYYGYNRNYPVVRRGTLALMTDEKIATPAGSQRAFIAELQSWPGNSGSPVFLSLGGMRHGGLALGEKFALLGFVLGAYKNELTAPVISDEKKLLTTGDQLPIGVSFIVPATRLREVLDSPAAQKGRDTLLNTSHANGTK
jgi:hypothetical protein